MILRCLNTELESLNVPLSEFFSKIRQLLPIKDNYNKNSIDFNLIIPLVKEIDKNYSYCKSVCL